ncbi:NADH-quinone oxidoreductase subunit J, partial [candidate division KSB1 bacterium]|nr:NADH-quinone oxidoreductase subunit J [candidate division KSB1 bacterium]
IIPKSDFNPTAEKIGHLLMKEFLIPFEIVSVFLLVALVGAAFIARKGT